MDPLGDQVEVIAEAVAGGDAEVECRVAEAGVYRTVANNYRQMFEDAGFTDLVIRVGRGGLFAHGRKPIPSNTNTAFDPDKRQEPADTVEFA